MCCHRQLLGSRYESEGAEARADCLTCPGPYDGPGRASSPFRHDAAEQRGASMCGMLELQGVWPVGRRAAISSTRWSRSSGLDRFSPAMKRGHLRSCSDDDIDLLESAGEDIHQLKGGKHASQRDLYVDRRGDVQILLKGGRGEPEPTGLNLNEIREARRTPRSQQHRRRPPDLPARGRPRRRSLR